MFILRDDRKNQCIIKADSVSNFGLRFLYSVPTNHKPQEKHWFIQMDFKNNLPNDIYYIDNILAIEASVI